MKMSRVFGLWLGESFAELQELSPQTSAIRPGLSGLLETREGENQSRSSFESQAFDSQAMLRPRSQSRPPSLLRKKWMLSKKGISEPLKDFLNLCLSEQPSPLMTPIGVTPIGVTPIGAPIGAPTPEFSAAARSQDAPAAPSATLRIVTRRAEQTMKRRQGQIPVLLVTRGFASHLFLSEASESRDFIPSPERMRLPLSSDLIFEVSERTSSDGTVTTEAKLEELEFLAAKLDLLKVRTLAVAFLNSLVNPESENRVAGFFREKGFTVVQSSNLGPGGERARWQRAVAMAYAEAGLREEKEQIMNAVASFKDRLAVEIWSEDGLRPFDRYDAQTGWTGWTGWRTALLKAAQGFAAPFVLHFGLENFSLITKDSGAMDSPCDSTCGAKPPGSMLPLPIQPTQQFEPGVWPIPVLGREDKGYEPGPMLLGRSHQLTVLDILFTRRHLNKVEEALEFLAPPNVERSRARILESVFTLAKAANGPHALANVDADDVTADLEQALIERIATFLALHAVEGDLVLTGCLAPAFSSLLQARRPDLRIQLDPEFDWFLSCAAGGRAVTGIQMTERQ